MIKIIKSSTGEPIPEDILSGYEKEGMILVSVNHVVYHDRVPIDGGVGGSRRVDRSVWMYHFRCADEKYTPHDDGHSSILR